MALDRSLCLLRGIPGMTPKDLSRLIANELGRLSKSGAVGGSATGPMLHQVLGDGRGTDVRLYLPPTPAADMERVAGELRAGQRNPYEVLHDAGIVVMNSGRSIGAGIALSGGSYSDVSLEVRGRHAVVTKKVTQQENGSDPRDGLLRHRAEAEWLSSASLLSSLFLAPSLIVDRPDWCEFEMRFFPAYSLAELVFQQRMTGSEAAEALKSVYDELRTTLYASDPIPTSWSDPDQDYLWKVRRRSRLLVRAAAAESVRFTPLLRARTIWVNGQRCPGLFELLDAIESARFWHPIIRPAAAHACHGDLILEDILIKPDPVPEVKLVDPNPYNRHGLFDLAKTMLSLWIGYEFVYFDFFDVQTREARDQLSIEIALGMPGRRDQYAEAAAEFMLYARNEISDVLALPRRSFDRLVRMASALTALAIPAFHLIRHRRPDRALAFFALGLLHGACALNDTTPPMLHT